MNKDAFHGACGKPPRFASALTCPALPAGVAVRSEDQPTSKNNNLLENSLIYWEIPLNGSTFKKGYMLLFVEV